MTKKNRYKIRWFIPSLWGILFLILALYSWQLWNRADEYLRSDLLNQAERVSQAINLNELRALSGTEADLALPEYKRLKSNLILTRRLFPESRFLYLMGQWDDRSIFFYVDSEPAGSEDESPTGQYYTDVTGPLLDAFSNAGAVVEGPTKDSGGTWVSALVPIVDPDSGEVAAVFGMDVDANRWNQLILNVVLFPLTLAFLLMIIVFLAVLFLVYRWKVPDRFQHTWLFRHSELCIALVFGLLVTGQIAWIVQNNERFSRRENFERIAAASTGYISAYLSDLEDYHLGGLASFFEASTFVDRQEFLTYTSALARDSKIQAWEWAPLVLADDLQEVEKQARQEDVFDYQVWELDEVGQKITAVKRPVYFPVLYVSPLAGNERALGFHLGSESTRRSALETAAQTNLVTATDPVTLVQETGNQVGVLVIKPVLGTGKSPSQEGFILAVIRMGDLLNRALGMRAGSSSFLYLDLYQMHAGSPPVYLAGNSSSEDVRAHIRNELREHTESELTFVQPIFAFSKVYVLAAHPRPAFTRLVPARAGWITTIIGFIVTVLAGSIIHLNSSRRYVLESLVAERTEELQKSEHKYRTLSESTSAVLWEFDAGQNLWTYVSPQITLLTGWTLQEWTNSQFWADHLHPEDRLRVLEYFIDVTSRRENPELEYRYLKPDGSIVWLRDVASMESLDGKVSIVRGFLIDITEKKQAEETLRLQSTALHSSANAIVITDRQGVIQWANPAFSSLTGYSISEAIGKNPRELVKSGEHDPAFYQQLWDTILAGNIWTGELVNRKKDGSLYQEEMTIAPVHAANGEITHFIAIKQDISERKQREQELEAIASISSALRTARTRADMLPITLEQLMIMLHADGAAMVLRSPVTSELALEAAEGEFAEGFSNLSDLVWVVSASVVESGEPFVTGDISREQGVLVSNTYRLTRAAACIPLIVDERVIGVLWIGRKAEILPKDIRLLTSIADIVANAIHRETLRDEALKQFESLQNSNRELKEAYDATIKGWSRAMDLRDKETEGHTQRVTKLTVRLAQLMGLSEEDLVHARRGALLHDIGKLGVPDRILHKPGPLDDAEWEIMHRHPQLAYEMIVPISYLQPAIDIPLCHHERWDGSGYPRGLKEKEIPLAARIFAIADVYDALTSNRPYRKAFSKEEALAYVREQSGKQFDPEVVRVFLSLFPDIEIVPSKNLSQEGGIGFPDEV